MQAILFADRKPFGSDPISQQFCPALLPLGGRPVLVHSIEDLATAGIDKIHLVISSQAYQIESLLGDGSRWGVQIEYLLSRGDERPSNIIHRYRDQFNSRLLLVRGDMMRSPCINELLDFSEQQAGSSAVSIQQQLAGVVLCDDLSRDDVLDLVDWSTITDNSENPTATLNLNDRSISLLQGLSDLFDTATSICSGVFCGINALGLKSESGLVHGRNRKISPSASIQGDVWLGNNVTIEDDVEIIGPAVIGDDVLIDKGSRLKNSVVLTDTYIGKGVNLENSLLSRKYIYREDMKMSLTIADDFLASSLGFAGFTLIDRTLAMLLLVLSFPLWVYAAFLAIFKSPGSFFASIKIQANHGDENDRESFRPRQVKAYQLNVSSPLLRNLPLLLNVIKGDIRLIGSSPLIKGIDIDDQISSLHSIVYGLLSTSNVDFDGAVSASEAAINDIVYEKKRGLISDIRYLIAYTRFLFQPQQWLGRTKNHSSTI